MYSPSFDSVATFHAKEHHKVVAKPTKFQNTPIKNQPFFILFYVFLRCITIIKACKFEH